MEFCAFMFVAVEDHDLGSQVAEELDRLPVNLRRKSVQWRLIVSAIPCVLNCMPTEPGAFYVMDRGYLDFTRLYALHQAGGFFVTRAKANMNARRIYSAPLNRSTGVICDQTILHNGFYAKQNYSDNSRRVRFKEVQSSKTLKFQTNHFVLSPQTISELYKNRWQVELFCKWLKQHLRIKKLLSNIENAVKTQICCTVST